MRGDTHLAFAISSNPAAGISSALCRTRRRGGVGEKERRSDERINSGSVAAAQMNVVTQAAATAVE